jgi:hypothetical protein
MGNNSVSIVCPTCNGSKGVIVHGTSRGSGPWCGERTDEWEQCKTCMGKGTLTGKLVEPTTEHALRNR